MFGHSRLPLSVEKRRIVGGNGDWAGDGQGARDKADAVVSVCVQAALRDGVRPDTGAGGAGEGAAQYGSRRVAANETVDGVGQRRQGLAGPEGQAVGRDGEGGRSNREDAGNVGQAVAAAGGQAALGNGIAADNGDGVGGGG